MRQPTPTARHPRKTSRDDGRRWNLLTALQTIAALGPTSRAEIARATGLTRATVSTLVTDLLADGLVREIGPAETESAGKPPTLLVINDAGREIVALDLSHHPFQAAVMDLTGDIRYRTTAPAAIGAAALSAVERLVADCLAHVTSPLLGIGVGTPGMIDSDGTIRDAAHLEWHDVPLRRILSDSFELPVTVGNDAHVSALAQLRSAPEETLLLVAVGEGIGAGLVLNGVLHTGDHLSSGEIGHVVVEPEGDDCRCGLRGCLETVAAVPAVLVTGHQFDADSAHDAGRRLGAVLAMVAAAIDVDRIVIASPLTEVDGYIDAVGGELRSRIHPTRQPGVDVTAAETPDIVLAGAAAAVMAEVLGVVLR